MYKYSLDKSSKKFTCPSCSKKTFVRFKYNETGEYLTNEYGRCDREDKCRYFKKPQIENNNNNNNNTIHTKQNSQNEIEYNLQIVKKTNFNLKEYNKTLIGYEENNFVQNLISNVPYPFEKQDIDKIIELYHIGTITSDYMHGATTFPFINIEGFIRAVQVKLFDKQNHTKKHTTTFLHSILKNDYINNNQEIPKWLLEYDKQQIKIDCLFGEHLLHEYKNNEIIIVESPKTAIIGTLYFGFPEDENPIWLAVGSKSYFTLERLQILEGKGEITVIPDTSEDGSTFDEWKNKAIYDMECKKIKNVFFIFLDYFEKTSTKEFKNKGYDIADYLITKDWKSYRNGKINTYDTNTKSTTSNNINLRIIETDYTDNFNCSDEVKKSCLNNLEKSINQSENFKQINVSDTLTPVNINIKPLDNDNPNYDKVGKYIINENKKSFDAQILNQDINNNSKLETEFKEQLFTHQKTKIIEKVNKAELIRTEAYKLYWIDGVPLDEVAKIIGVNKSFMPQLLLEVIEEFDDTPTEKYQFTI